MKNVFLVLEGDKQVYFLQQQNAEKRANETSGEIFAEEISEKVYKQRIKEKGFFEDLPETDKVNNSKSKTDNTTALTAQMEALKAENEKLKAIQNLSFEDAAELFKQKAKLLKDVGIFQAVENMLNEAREVLNENDSLKSDYYAIQLVGGNYNTKDKIFSTSNVEFIKAFIAFSDDKINTKIEELKKEVQAI